MSATASNQHLILFVVSLGLFITLLSVGASVWIVRAMKQIAQRGEILRAADITYEASRRKEELARLEASLISAVDQLNTAMDRHERNHGHARRSHDLGQ